MSQSTTPRLPHGRRAFTLMEVIVPMLLTGLIIFMVVFGFMMSMRAREQAATNRWPTPAPTSAVHVTFPIQETIQVGTSGVQREFVEDAPYTRFAVKQPEPMISFSPRSCMQSTQDDLMLCLVSRSTGDLHLTPAAEEKPTIPPWVLQGLVVLLALAVREVVAAGLRAYGDALVKKAAGTAGTDDDKRAAATSAMLHDWANRVAAGDKDVENEMRQAAGTPPSSPAAPGSSR